MSSFCADTTSRKLSNSGRSHCLFNTLAHPPTHFPEIGLEPGGFLEDRDQLALAGGRGLEIGEEVQVRPRFRRDLLVWHTGILVDPNAIGVRCGPRIGLRGEPRRDFRVADHAGGKGHLQRQQIAAHSRIEHIARIG